MSGGPTLSVWLDATDLARADIPAAVRSLVEQGIPQSDILCLVGPHAEGGPAAGSSVRIVPLTGGAEGVLGRLLAEATADWILWMDASARMAPGAVAVIGRALSRFDVDLFYGDSDVDGARIRRPAFSPVRLRSQDYLGDLRGFRVEAITQAGAFPPDPAGAHPLHLSLRLGRSAERVLRIPQVLTRSAHSVVPATEAGRTVVSRFLVGQGISADVTLEGDRLRVRYAVPSEPLVSIIIPTRGGRAIIAGRDSVLVVDAVRGLVERSTYAAIEIIVVADDETPQSVIDQLIAVAGDRLRLVRWSEEFNFSAKINRGAIFASGEYLVLLNDDVDVISADWIESLLGLASQPNIGLVGALLLFEDGTVQHGGHLYAASWAGHAAFGWAADRDDDLGSMSVDREVSGVTAACAMIPADIFWEVGGLSLDYAGNYNDVDLSLKVAATGRSVLWTPHSRLHHFESQTRVATVEPAELETLRAHWGTRLLTDPFWRQP